MRSSNLKPFLDDARRFLKSKATSKVATVYVGSSAKAVKITHGLTTEWKANILLLAIIPLLSKCSKQTSAVEKLEIKKVIKL